MATTAGRRIFVDTNVLVYASVVEAPLHQSALDNLLQRERLGEELLISRQVLREYLATLSRPQQDTLPPPMATLTAQARAFEGRFRIAEDGPAVTEQLLTLLEQIPVGGRQIHDANIVATMLANNVRQLLTHNVADFQRFAAFITVLPLQAPADQP
jgi:predicted nucleic acid-binding protein